MRTYACKVSSSAINVFLKFRKKGVSIFLRVSAINCLIHVSGVTKSQILKSILFDQSIQKNGLVLSNYGVWLKSNFTDRTFRLSLLGYRNKLDKFLRNENKKMVFLDIGSNQGVFTLIACTNPNFVQIHSFEPNPQIYSYLEENTSFAQSQAVSIHNKAISRVNGRIGFSMDPSHSGAGKLDANSQTLYVESVNYLYLDDQLKDSNYPIFVKIDVEGSEYQVLEQLLLMKNFSCVTSIFIELNDSHSDVNLLLDFFRIHRFIQIFEKRSKSNCDALFVREWRAVN